MLTVLSTKIKYDIVKLPFLDNLKTIKINLNNDVVKNFLSSL